MFLSLLFTVLFKSNVLPVALAAPTSAPQSQFILVGAWSDAATAKVLTALNKITTERATEGPERLSYDSTVRLRMGSDFSVAADDRSADPIITVPESASQAVVTALLTQVLYPADDLAEIRRWRLNASRAYRSTFCESLFGYNHHLVGITIRP